VNADELAAHLGRMLPDTRVIPLDRLRQDLTLGCVDGRNPGCVAGAPGGNAGLFLLLLASLEDVTGRVLGDQDVTTLLHRYLERFGSFYLHSDRPALMALGRALVPAEGDSPAREAELADPVVVEAILRAPPAHLRPRLPDLLVMPPHVGCGHLRLLLSEPGVYRARAELTAAVIRAFFEALWAGDDRMIFDVLPGDHHEEAVVQVHAGAPNLLMACPHYGAMELFLHHPDAVGWLETLQARFAAEEGWISMDQLPRLVEVQERLGNHQLQATLERLAPGLPVFDVHLEPPDPATSDSVLPPRIRVSSAGVVPKGTPALAGGTHRAH
jgi:hypothetical protein